MRLGRSCSFSDLGEICRNLARSYAKTDYRRRFSFVDSITEETYLGEIEILTNKAFESLLDNPSGCVLAPSELIDFDEVANFEIPDLEISESEITSSQLIDALKAGSITAIDDFKILTLVAFDGADVVLLRDGGRNRDVFYGSKPDIEISFGV